MKIYEVFISFYKKSKWGNNKCFEKIRISSMNEQEAKEDAEEKFKKDNPFNVSAITVYDIERYIKPR